MFSKEPDEIANGDYLYCGSCAESAGEHRELIERHIKRNFRHEWLCGGANPFFYEPCMLDLPEFAQEGDMDLKFEETIGELAREGKPFVLRKPEQGCISAMGGR